MDTKKILLTGLLGASFALSTTALSAQERKHKAAPERVVIKKDLSVKQTQLLEKAAKLSAKASALASEGNHAGAAKYAAKAAALLNSSFQTSGNSVTTRIAPAPPKPPVPPKAPRGKSDVYSGHEDHAKHAEHAEHLEHAHRAEAEAKAAFKEAMRMHGEHQQQSVDKKQLHKALQGMEMQLLQNGELHELKAHLGELHVLKELQGLHGMKGMEALKELKILGNIEGLEGLKVLDSLQGLEALEGLIELKGDDGNVHAYKLRGNAGEWVGKAPHGHEGHQMQVFTSPDGNIKGEVKIELHFEGNGGGAWNSAPHASGNGSHMTWESAPKPSGKSGHMTWKGQAPQAHGHGQKHFKVDTKAPGVHFFGGNDGQKGQIKILGLPGHGGEGEKVYELLMDGEGNHGIGDFQVLEMNDFDFDFDFDVEGLEVEIQTMLEGMDFSGNGAKIHFAPQAKNLRKSIGGKSGGLFKVDGKDFAWTEKSCDSEAAPECEVEVKTFLAPRKKKASSPESAARELIQEMQNEMEALRDEIAELRRSMGDDPLVRANTMQRRQQSSVQPVSNKADAR